MKLVGRESCGRREIHLFMFLGDLAALWTYIG
jgi:hypothetical protein